MLKDLIRKSKYKHKMINERLIELCLIDSRKFIYDTYTLDKEIDKLFSKGANINFQGNDGLTPLMAAIKSNSESDIFMVKKLLSYKPDLSIKNKEGENAINLAEKHPNKSFRKEFVDSLKQVNFAPPLNVKSLEKGPNFK